MITIAISNQKGGVGKTTLAFNLAHVLADRYQYNVLAIDNDPQGNLTSSFIQDPESMTGKVLDAHEGRSVTPEKISDNLSLLGANTDLAPVAERDFQVIFRLKEAISLLQTASHSHPHDYVIIDCLPAFGHLQLAALTAADLVLIPVKPAPYALSGIKDLFDTIHKTQKFINPALQVLGIVINQIDGRDLVMEREMEEVLRETYKKLVFKKKLSKRIHMEESPTFQKAITAYKPKSEAAKEFMALAKEVHKRIGQMTRTKNKRVK